MPKYIDIEPYIDCRIVANSEDKGIAVKDIPTADVVNVVRCKDCKHFELNVFGITECKRTFQRFAMNDNDFCSYGERKENAACRI